MDGNTIRRKLIGNEDERAVSPVIGVVLMVAVVTILAAVVAVFVMGMGEDLQNSQEATGAASFNFENPDNDTAFMTVSVTSEGNANYWEVSGNVTSDDTITLDGVGDSATLYCDDPEDVDNSIGGSGSITVAASMDGEDGSLTAIGEETYTCP